MGQNTRNGSWMLKKSDAGRKEKEWSQHIQPVQRLDVGSNLGPDLGSGKSDDEKEKEEGLSVQLLSGFTICLVALLQGAGVSSSSVLHSLLRQKEPRSINSSDPPLFDFGLNLGFVDFSISEEEVSWVASVWVLSHLLFAPVAGFLNDKFGRRKALMVDTLLFSLGFLILTFATSLPCLLLARLLLGCPLVSQVQQQLHSSSHSPSLLYV